MEMESQQVSLSIPIHHPGSTATITATITIPILLQLLLILLWLQPQWMRLLLVPLSSHRRLTLIERRTAANPTSDLNLQLPVTILIQIQTQTSLLELLLLSSTIYRFLSLPTLPGLEVPSIGQLLLLTLLSMPRIQMVQTLQLRKHSLWRRIQRLPCRLE